MNGRREINNNLRANYRWIETKPASNRVQRRLLLKLARKNGTDTSTWEGVSDHKDVIAAMKMLRTEIP